MTKDTITAPSSALPPAWADLLEALALLAQGQNNAISPFHCEHDTLTVMADPSEFTETELARLDKLGFVPNDNFGDCFTSFRYGSA